MDFELNEEQKLLRDTTREVLTRAYDTEKRNKIVAADPGWSTDVWKQLAEVGLLGLSFSEDDGGMDAGPVEIMAVMTEVGRRLAPEPILDAVLLPGGLISAVGSADQRKRVLPGVSEGSTLLAFAHNETGSRWPDVEVKVAATEDGGSWSLSGVKNPVPHGGSANVIVVSAALPGGGTGLFLVDGDATGLERKSYVTHDGGRAAQLSFTDVAAEPLGDGSDASAAIVAAEVKAQAALAAEAVGAMEEALRLTTDYLKQRKQFGVPLAKFQALTFRAADMYVLLELARSMSLYATMNLADDVVDQTVASRTKLQISRSSRKIGQEAIQLHGGIGVTAEYPVGHYVSRLTAIEHTFGGADEHLRILSR
ncbi:MULTISPECIES: acyl-CoA dehydrogenase family protein [Nocardiaceae]|uniref:acyl-CoA dehydrogenase family protein n=1 Tax=Nocardiaceae TaxID=85025 RepID=UPI00037EAF1F|nr:MULTISPECIES: acyl-CoA dehydrogenase family protein [Rhodococcus]OZC80745.1 acyl-CoA dehydrogenase [Rhodococcus sp. 06-418-1B]OZD14320.1 acyl-CoA dehydrogenase [Rhodococcus sp. 06-156-3C]OZD16010.1 acyl-CoA dehydrogenase [Rhodococcus sp. 06-156-4C]OZD24657.1 acyl-CoA dehydrogenase [Rhodococcus sp. 06-156-3b]OZD28612.1 acyl-CoA dehydrogenase [Rhodococcus sp. 06-156-4a]